MWVSVIAPACVVVAGITARGLVIMYERWVLIRASLAAVEPCTEERATSRIETVLLTVVGKLVWLPLTAIQNAGQIH